MFCSTNIYLGEVTWKQFSCLKLNPLDKSYILQNQGNNFISLCPVKTTLANGPLAFNGDTCGVQDIISVEIFKLNISSIPICLSNPFV